MSGSAAAQEQSLQNLIDTSGALKQTLDLGIKTIGGAMDLGQQGIIAPNGMPQAAFINQFDADNYNASVRDVQAFSWGTSAQEYIDDQVQRANVDLSDALNAYVGATSVLIEVVKVNEMAIEAETTGDVNMQQEVTDYVTNNDVELDQVEIDTYNVALDDTVGAAQTFAAFTAVAVNGDAVNDMQTQADNVGQNFVNANDATFDNMTGDVGVTFFQGNDLNANILVNVGYAFTSVSEVLQAGEVSQFYTTGPTANSCFFSTPEEFEDPNSACYSGPPPQ